ncbi:MAG: hypothetical protein V3T72_08735, partial [Thermoanaerobaculia bacterium]
MLAISVGAHVGSPDIFYEGQAGPYPVRVIVRPPGVVPGLAEISVRVEAAGVERVSARPVRWDAGLEGAPRADVAQPVRGDNTLYSAELWLMTSGSYSVYVTVEGDRGEGTAIVPVQSVATRRLEMPSWIGAVLAILGVLLVAGAVRIAGAAVDSTLAAGEEPDGRKRWRARRAMVVATGLTALILWGGKAWWTSIDGDHLRSLFTAYSTRAAVEVEGGWRILELEIDDERWQRAPALAPDHGKLMHMFLIREPELDAFAHVHPVRQSEALFAVALPDLPAGRYRVYADVIDESAFAQTLTQSVEIPAPVADPGPPPAGLEPDPDDSWHLGSPASADRHPFDDGFVMTRETSGEPVTVGREMTLAFTLTDASGEPAALEPYMGMTSHAAVRRHDGAVFVHLHPTGTISMAAQRLFERRLTGAEKTMDHGGHAMHMGAVTRA